LVFSARNPVSRVGRFDEARKSAQLATVGRNQQIDQRVRLPGTRRVGRD
jgi:hypothetical protein